MSEIEELEAKLRVLRRDFEEVQAMPLGTERSSRWATVSSEIRWAQQRQAALLLEELDD